MFSKIGSFATKRDSDHEIRFSQVGGGYIEDERSRLQPSCLFDFFVLHTLGSLEISNF